MFHATLSFCSSQDCSPQSVCPTGQVTAHGFKPMADTFACSGLMPHAFYKSGTWLLDYVLKSPWPNGQGVGPLIQRLWVQVPLGMFAHLTHRSPAVLRLASSTCCSRVAQWLACWAHNPKVPGSKPGSAILSLSAPEWCSLWDIGPWKTLRHIGPWT